MKTLRVFFILLLTSYLQTGFAQESKPAMLYANCENIVDFPYTYTENYRLESDNGEVAFGEEKNTVIIRPNGTQAKCTISIYDGEKLIEQKDFAIRKAPNVRYALSLDGDRIDLEQGLSLQSLDSTSQLAVDIVLPEEFISQAPKDARFRVTEYAISIARGSGTIKTYLVRKPKPFALRSILPLTQPGDRLLIQVRKLAQLNHRNQVSENATEALMVLGLN